MRESTPQNSPSNSTEELKSMLAIYKQKMGQILDAALDETRRKVLEEQRRIFEEGIARAIKAFEEKTAKLEEKRKSGINEILLIAYEESIKKELNMWLEYYRTELSNLTL